MIFSDPFFVDDVTIEIPAALNPTSDGVVTAGTVGTYAAKASVEPMGTMRDLEAMPGAALLVGSRRFYMDFSSSAAVGVRNLVTFFDGGAGAPASEHEAAKIVHNGVRYTVQDVKTWDGEYVEVIGDRRSIGG